jgi:predicted nucleic acid-binding protein
VIVLDASAVAELLLDTAAGRRIATLIDDPAIGLHVPHLLDVEVTHVLRRYVREGAIDKEDGQAAIDDLLSLDLQRHSHEGLLERAWSLRDNFTAYDAVYVALAEALDATLVTCDAKLARSRASGARIQLVN